MTRDWKHGEEGRRYKVIPDSVWNVGNHVYVCSDIMESSVFDEVESGTLVYSDPPWGQGLANTFRTTAGFERATYDWKDIYRRVAGFAERQHIPLYVEGSSIDTKFGTPIPHLISRQEKTHRNYWDVTYFGGSRSGVFYSGLNPSPEEMDLTGQKDFEMVTTVLEHYPVGTVIDPCSGLGGIPLEAEKSGWSSFSNELSPFRMSRAMCRMEKLTGYKPREVGI